MVATLDYQSIRNLGFRSRKSEYAIEKVRLVASDDFDLEDISRMSDESVEALTQIKGVGRWTSEYVLLRVVGRPPCGFSRRHQRSE